MSGILRFSLSLLVVAALIGFLFVDSLRVLFGYWIGSEDYSHGLFVPFISLFLAWQAREEVTRVAKQPSWWGLAVFVSGLLLYWIGELASLFVVQHVALWTVIVGLALSLLGLTGVREVAFPLAYLLTSIPLPVFFYASLSSRLQLWSSALGVGCLQLVGVTAFREGNVIDLGPVQLQVVEACSGIRYLLPLVSLALLCAYLFKDAMWKRVLLVVSAVPISILVNGFRIGMIGVLVEWQGQGAAEGFYHFFEGWVLFMASLGLLILEMWTLAKLASKGDRRSFLDRFTWSVPRLERSSSNAPLSLASLPFPYLVSIAFLFPTALASTFVVQRVEAAPMRALFIDFPMRVKEWSGTAMTLEKQYIEALRFDDYVLAEYRYGSEQPVSFYSAYYRSQRKGQSAHSPSSCLPGGGWEISHIETVQIPVGEGNVRDLPVNRALIQKDRQKQVVLYWFKQRDRLLADEYLVKFYLLWDALTRNRTDGALVRIASMVGPGESEDVVDRRLQRFVAAIESELNRYVPD